MKCVIQNCNFIGKTEEDWIAHFKKEHPSISTLNLSGKRINLKE